VLELGQPPHELLALLAERLGQRHDRLDEPALAVVVGGKVVHSGRLGLHGRATLSKSDAAMWRGQRRALGACPARARDTVTSARATVASPPRHGGTKRC